MNPAAQGQESFGQRMSAVNVMRDRAKSLRKQADKWEALADSLDEIERFANSQSKDGSEGGPCIGVGSPAEELLWELAMSPFERGF